MTHGFTAQNRLLKLIGYPIEDSYFEDSGYPVAAVADGVTRDPRENLLPLPLFVSEYCIKRPEHARIAADLVTSAFALVKDFSYPGESALKEVMAEGNKRIRDYTSRHMGEIDYLVNDFPGCTAAGAVMHDGTLFGAYICDSGIAVVDKDGNTIMKTADEGPTTKDKAIWQDPRLKEKSWRDPKVRKIIRSEYRNNPANPHAFGVLTGEKEAMDYVRTFSTEFKPGYHLLVYTDGLEPVLFNPDGEIRPEFLDKINQVEYEGLRRLCNARVHSEGTLVHLRRNNK